MSKSMKIWEKVAKNETVYLLNDFEDWSLKIENGKCFGKFKGGNPYEIDQSTKLVTDTVLEAVEITAEEYEKY